MELNLSLLRSEIPVFGYEPFLSMRFPVERSLQGFAERLQKSPEGRADMAKYYNYATLGIIADITFGDSFHYIEDENKHVWILGFFLGAYLGSGRNSV